MGRRGYRQYCGLAKALEIVGERWALLIIRDLLVGPRRYTELRRGLPRIPTNILTSRLRELEDHGVAQRRITPRPEHAVVYELTPFGQALEDAVLALARWGASTLVEPRPDEIVTTGSLVMALRATFHPSATRGRSLRYELRFGDIVLHATVDDGVLHAAGGPLPGCDLTIETGPALRALMSRDLTVPEALDGGLVQLTGPADLLATFVDIFHIDPVPRPAPAPSA